MSSIEGNVLAKFEKWILTTLGKDISDPERSHFNCFILISVSIDNLAAMRYGADFPGYKRGDIRRRYEKFIENYFPKEYEKHSAGLYKGFRCHLIHAFQLDGFDVQQEESARRHHLKKLKSGNICLHSGELCNDLMKAFAKYKAELIGEKPNSETVAAFRRSKYKKWLHTVAEAA